MASPSSDVRLLIVPGLQGSSADHWQSRLEREHPGAVRIAVADWNHADLDTWANAIGQALARASAPEAPSPGRVGDPLLRWRRSEAPTLAPTRWLAVAHSYGCLALAHYLLRGSVGIEAALLVAPANPDRFGIPDGQLDRTLPRESTLVFSRNDPWLSEPDARYLGRRWGSALVDAGLAGHINPASGHGSLAPARQWVAQQLQWLSQAERPAQLQPRRLPERAPAAWHFAV